MSQEVFLHQESEPLDRLGEVHRRVEHLRREATTLGERVRDSLSSIERSSGRVQANQRVTRLREDLEVALREIEGLRVALQTRGVIEQAKGMIMITLKLEEEAAFHVLVERSQHSHRKLVDVARDIVAIGMRPTGDAAGDRVRGR